MNVWVTDMVQTVLPFLFDSAQYQLLAPLFSHNRKVQLEKGVTSIAIGGEGKQFFVGTEAAQMYRFGCDNFREELISTSHNSAVKDGLICL